ncbi:3'-5' exoribonuclease 1, partial [Fasciola hepatica]
PTFPVNLIPEHSTGVLPSSSSSGQFLNAHSDQNHAQAHLINRVQPNRPLHAFQQHNYTSPGGCTPNVELHELHCCPLVRVPAPVYYMPNSCLLGPPKQSSFTECPTLPSSTTGSPLTAGRPGRAYHEACPSPPILPNDLRDPSECVSPHSTTCAPPYLTFMYDPRSAGLLPNYSSGDWIPPAHNCTFLSNPSGGVRVPPTLHLVHLCPASSPPSCSIPNTPSHCTSYGIVSCNGAAHHSNPYFLSDETKYNHSDLCARSNGLQAFSASGSTPNTTTTANTIIVENPATANSPFFTSVPTRYLAQSADVSGNSAAFNQLQNDLSYRNTENLYPLDHNQLCSLDFRDSAGFDTMSAQRTELTEINSINSVSSGKLAGSEDASTPLSDFVQSSVSDIPLVDLEELFARTSVNDVYLGPVRGPDAKILPLDPNVRVVNDCVTLPYSSSSLAFAPPGIIMVTEMWSVFVTERLSHCNHRIHQMNIESLRNCLYDHGLNQLGSPIILRRRLQEFVRRVRDFQSSDSRRLSKIAAAAAAVASLEQNAENLSADSATVSPEQTKLTVDDVEDASPTQQQQGPASLPQITKLPKPVILTPDTFYHYLLIIDLEATCDFQERHQNTPEYPHEIIEFPVLLYNTRTRRCVSVFHAYCKPRVRPDLTAFCTNLTQISQAQVDSAQPFPNVLAKIENWLFNKHKLSDLRCAIVCDCSADMGKFMRIQCHLNDIPLPSWATVWINLSKAFRTFYKLPSKHRVTLSTMLRDLNLSFIGQQHRGLDDAINILRVVRTLLADGCLLRVNERVDFGRAPTFVASVPRLVAEATSGLMGSRLVLLSRKSRASTGSGGYSEKDKSSQLPTDLPEDHRESLLWLANVQKSRLPKD